MNLGLRWVPQWSSSPVKDSAVGVSGFVKSPFHRMIWEIFAVSLWDKVFLGKRKSVLRVLADYGHSRWISEIGPLGTLYRSSVTSIFRQLTTRVDSPDFGSFPWSIYQHVASVDSIYCRAAAALSGLLTFAYGTCMDILKRCGGGFSDDELQPMYPVGRFGFKEEGAGKVRVFAIPNALKQALLRPAHDWCMEVLSRIPMDGTFDQLKPLSRLRKTCCLFSYDLSSATDRFPLNVQAVIISAIWNSLVAFAWVVSGLGTNVFSAPASKDRRVGPKFVCFNAGQPLGYLSSWPLFALCHHVIVWYSAEQVYPGRTFRNYALLGDDIVIGDDKVAKVYRDIMDQLGLPAPS